MLTQWVPSLSHRTVMVSVLAACGSEQGGDCDLWVFFFFFSLLDSSHRQRWGGPLEKFLLKSW